MVDLCRDDRRELFRIAKQRVGEKKDVRASHLKDENGTVKVSGLLKENLEGAYGKVDEC